MSSWQDHFNNPFSKTGASKTPPGPKSVNVVVIPASPMRPHIATVPLIESPIRPVTRPTDPHQMTIFRKASALSMMYYYNESACQPNIRLVPDTYNSRNWDQGAWERRCVVGAGRMHLFYTLSTNGMSRNPKVENLVCGDVFILKVSDSTDEDGLNFYVDVEKDDVVQNVMAELLQQLAVQTQEHIDDIGRRSDT